jgi:hypothetical protein
LYAEADSFYSQLFERELIFSKDLDKIFEIALTADDRSKLYYSMIVKDLISFFIHITKEELRGQKGEDESVAWDNKDIEIESEEKFIV